MPDVDVLIGIVGSYIFDQEFFKAYVDAGKKVVLFFDTDYDVSNTIMSEVQEVEAFRKRLQLECTCLSYSGFAGFADAVRGCLDTL